jgi:hypothetical protein
VSLGRESVLMDYCPGVLNIHLLFRGFLFKMLEVYRICSGRIHHESCSLVRWGEFKLVLTEMEFVLVALVCSSSTVVSVA